MNLNEFLEQNEYLILLLIVWHYITLLWHADEAHDTNNIQVQ